MWVFRPRSLYWEEKFVRFSIWFGGSWVEAWVGARLEETLGSKALNGFGMPDVVL